MSVDIVIEAIDSNNPQLMRAAEKPVWEFVDRDPNTFFGVQE